MRWFRRRAKAEKPQEETFRYGTRVRVIGGLFDGLIGRVCNEYAWGEYMVSFYDETHDLSGPGPQFFNRKQLTAQIEKPFALSEAIVVIDGTVKDAPFELEPAMCLVEYQ